MASTLCRSARTLTSRTIPSFSKSIPSSPKSVPSPFSSSTRLLPRPSSRMVLALASIESMMPLHSAIASARLKSILASDSSCWSFLSQERTSVGMVDRQTARERESSANLEIDAYQPAPPHDEDEEGSWDILLNTLLYSTVLQIYRHLGLVTP